MVVDIGVPQGSILGPLTLLLFINDLLNAGSCVDNLTMFADDNTYLTNESCVRDGVSAMQNMIINSKKWFSANQLLIHHQKRFL